MATTITRSYETREAARNVVETLAAEGLSSSGISIIGPDMPASQGPPGEGAAVGAGLGGAAGLLAGLGLVAGRLADRGRDQRGQRA